MSEEISKETLRTRMSAAALGSAEEKVLLEDFLKSAAAGSMDGHRWVASAIYGVADDAPEPQRSLLLEQMFHTLMRALEDYATLCIMWLQPDKSPLQAFLEADKAAIRQFYARTRKGLDDESMFKIYGLSSGEFMKSKGLVAQGDYYLVESVLGWAHGKYLSLLEAFGRVYHSTVEEADEVIGAWQISYAMSALGTKMILDKKGSPASLLLGLGEVQGGAKGVYSAKITVDSRFGEETLHHVDDVCAEIRDLAEIQRGLLLDPAAGLARSRSRFEKEYSPSGESVVKTEGSGAAAEQGIQVKEIELNSGPSPLKITHSRPLNEE